MEHQNRHATSVIVSSHINSPNISANAYVHKLQHSAQSRLLNDLFLLHGSRGPPSICSLEAMGEEGEYEACYSTRRLDVDRFWLSGGSLALPCSSGLFNPSGCAVNKFRKSWGLWTFLIAILSIRARTKTWKRIADRLSNELLSRSLSCASDESQFLFLQQVDLTIEETPATLRLPFNVLSLRQLSFLKSAWMSGLTCHSALKAVGRAAMPSCGREVSTRVLPKRRNSSQHSLAFHRDLLSYAYLRARQGQNSELRVAHQHLGIAYFHHLKYPRRPLNAPKSLILQLRLQHKPIQAISRSSSIPTLTSSIFTCCKKLHQSTNLLTFQCITASVERFACSWAGGKRMDFRPTHYGVTSGPQALKSTRNFFFCFVFRFLAKAMRALDEKQRIYLV